VARRKRDKASENGSRKVLAKLTEEERIAYVRKRALLEHAELQMIAAMALIQQSDKLLQDKYALPNQFDVSLITGDITEVAVDAEADRV